MWVFSQTLAVLHKVEGGDMGREKESQSSHKRDREGQVLVELCAPHSGHGISREGERVERQKEKERDRKSGREEREVKAVRVSELAK